MFWKACFVCDVFSRLGTDILPFCLTFRLLMPLLCKDMVDVLDTNNSTLNDSSLSNFAFLYGVFPTAPSVGIYAVYYNAELEVVSLPPSDHYLLFHPFFIIPCRFILFLFFFESGHLRDGDLHFALGSDNVCFCLVSLDLLERPSVGDGFSAERQR